MPFVKADKIPKGTVWVKPELVAQVKFANWTGDKKLRAPVYLGLRDDKPSSEVSREEAPAPGFLPLDKKVTSEIDGHSLKFTNLDKLYYPEDGYTKRDLLNYYDSVAELLLPHLRDRPLSLKRYPNGIHEPYFFQKNTPAGYPSWLRTKTVDRIRYVLADDRASLLYLTNLGCIDQNPWMSRVGSLEHPDYILIDLDPQECEFAKIVEAALLVKQKLDAVGLTGYPKTTGGDGMHIFIPIEPVYSYEQARTFAEVIARMIAAERPDLFTTPRAVAAREKNRVCFDYLQIAESKTISAPYVARGLMRERRYRHTAWEEVKPSLLPSQFNIVNAPERFARVGDLFAGVLKPQGIEEGVRAAGISDETPGQQDRGRDRTGTSGSDRLHGDRIAACPGLRGVPREDPSPFECHRVELAPRYPGAGSAAMRGPGAYRRRVRWRDRKARAAVRKRRRRSPCRFCSRR